MKKYAGFLILVVATYGCDDPAYVGKFIAEDTCLLFDHVRIYPDKTADLKFRSIGEAVNWDIKVTIGNDTVVEARDYSFIYRHDSLIGNSIATYDCVCIRKSVKEAREKAKTVR